MGDVTVSVFVLPLGAWQSLGPAPSLVPAQGSPLSSGDVDMISILSFRFTFFFYIAVRHLKAARRCHCVNNFPQDIQLNL